MSESNTNPTINLYQGKNVHDMTREELIEAVIELGQMYNDALEDSLRTLTKVKQSLSRLP